MAYIHLHLIWLYNRNKDIDIFVTNGLLEKTEVSTNYIRATYTKLMNKNITFPCFDDHNDLKCGMFR